MDDFQLSFVCLVLCRAAEAGERRLCNVVFCGAKASCNDYYIVGCELSIKRIDDLIVGVTD